MEVREEGMEVQEKTVKKNYAFWANIAHNSINQCTAL